jgi:hypothetical protein
VVNHHLLPTMLESVGSGQAWRFSSPSVVRCGPRNTTWPPGKYTALHCTALHCTHHNCTAQQYVTVLSKGRRQKVMQASVGWNNAVTLVQLQVQDGADMPRTWTQGPGSGRSLATVSDLLGREW